MTEIIFPILAITAVASLFNFGAIHSVFSCPVGTTMSSMPKSKDSLRNVVTLSLLIGSLMPILPAITLAILTENTGASEDTRMALVLASFLVAWVAGVLGGIEGNNAYGRKRERIRANQNQA